jgi:hypothetical protein
LVENFSNPNCSGPSTGKIFNFAQGGVFPYQYSLNNSDYQSIDSFANLLHGTYLWGVLDKNGCKAQIEIKLKEIMIPNLDYKENYEIELGDSVEMSINSSLLQNVVKWSLSKVNCDTCLTTSAFPLNDARYEVNVTSLDGCSKMAQINVKVKKVRSFVTSNIISANGDGINESPAIYGGKDVGSILSYDIYDRWGNKVFSESNIGKGRSVLKFNGKFNNRDLAEGSYTWIANVLYIDGVVIQYTGSMTIIR